MRKPHPLRDHETSRATQKNNFGHVDFAQPSFGLRDGIAPEPIRTRIERVSRDIEDIKKFYNMELSPRRANKLRSFFTAELNGLESSPFSSYSQDERVDYLLLKNWLQRNLKN